MPIKKLFFDLETTGVHPHKNAIVQIAALLEIDGDVLDVFQADLAPHFPCEIDDGALRVIGKTREEIQAYPPHEEAYEGLTAFLGAYIDRYDKRDKAWLVGFNSRSFDDPFLRLLFERCGDTFFGSWFWSDTLDVLVLASEYLLERRSRMPSFKLHRVASELGIMIDEDRLHDALYDVELTRQIYRVVTRREEEI